MKTIRAIHGKTLRDKIRSDHLRHLSGIQDILNGLRFEEESGMPMWEEWRTTVWQRSLETVVYRECAVEAGRRNAGKKVSSKPLRLNLWKNRR